MYADMVLAELAAHMDITTPAAITQARLAVAELADTAAQAATAELAALRLVPAIVAMQEAVAAVLAETVV